MKIVIIDYGAGNTQSVIFALQRLGLQPVVSNNANVISTADKVIFPGVGHAKTAMNALKENSLHHVITDLKQPVLGICLGMQLLCSYSEEGNTKCLGVFNQQVKLFEPTLKVPHIGWNEAYGTWDLSSLNSYYYFVHSYYVPVGEYTSLQCNYGHSFSAAIKKDNFYGVQFHPEKSGKDGEMLLQKFIAL